MATDFSKMSVAQIEIRRDEITKQITALKAEFRQAGKYLEDVRRKEFLAGEQAELNSLVAQFESSSIIEPGLTDRIKAVMRRLTQ